MKKSAWLLNNRLNKAETQNADWVFSFTKCAWTYLAEHYQGTV